MELSSPNHPLVGGDWNHGILNDFPETVGNGMSSSQLTFTHSLHHFSEGWVETNHQPVLRG